MTMHLSRELGEHLDEQIAFWKDVFGIRLDPSKGLFIPPKPAHADLLLVMPAEKLLFQFLISHLRKLQIGKAESFLESRDELEITKCERPKGNYGIWCVRASEPDHMQVSAEGFKEAYGKKGFFRAMNLTERLAFGLAFLRRESHWPDEDSTTLCASSVTHLGNIPSVSQKGGRLFINIHHPSHKEPKMGVRGVFIC